jgi:serine/threonine-protein kinase
LNDRERDSDGGWLGKYDLIAELPREGVADSFLAAVVAPGGYARVAVLNILRPDASTDPAAAEKFVAAARIGTLLNHANIVETYEVSAAGSKAFAATEYVEGQTLARIVERIGAGELPRGMWLRVLVDVLAGLHHAHEAIDDAGAPLRLTHLHLGPASVVVSYDGQVKLAGFGKLRTRGEQVPPYLAPEQARGEETDRATDVYAVGVMLWEACTRAPLWDAGVDAMTELAEGRVPSLRQKDPDVPKALADIVGRALSPAPDDRYSTAMHMQTDLEGFLRASGDRPPSREIGKIVAHAFLEERLRATTIVEEQLRRLRARSFAAAEDEAPLSLLRLETLSPLTPGAKESGREVPSSPRAIKPVRVLAPTSPRVAVKTEPSGSRFMWWFALGVAVALVGGFAAVYAMHPH